MTHLVYVPVLLQKVLFCCYHLTNVLQEREAQNEEMKKEKDEFFLKMEKQLEESEKRREIAELKKEREIQEMTAKYEAAAGISIFLASWFTQTVVHHVRH